MANNTILIKRGLKADLDKLTLLSGELAVALDTQELYVGDKDGNVKIIKGGASGAVESADKLTVSRTISATGDATGSVAFDGSQNVELALELATSGVTAGTYSKVTVDEKGRVTSGTNVAIEDITDLSTELAKLATKEELKGYVKVVEGKDLSTNDFTNELKTKLEGLNNYDDADVKASIATKVDKVEGKGLSTEDFTTELKTKLEGLSNYDDATIKADIAKKANSADVYTKTDVDGKVDTINGTITSTKEELNTAIEAKATKATTISGYGITDAYTKTEVDAKVASVYKYKGSVANEDALPTADQVIGDVYNLEDTGMNVAWTGEGWDKLGSVVDLTPYLTKEDAGKTYASKATTLEGYGITDAYTKTAVDTSLNGKVDKVEGKALSTNDFTNDLKTKLESIDLSLYTKTTDLETNYAKKATTISGYGITDAYTKTEIDTALGNKLDTTAVIDGGTF